MGANTVDYVFPEEDEKQNKKYHNSLRACRLQFAGPALYIGCWKLEVSGHLWKANISKVRTDLYGL